MASTKMDKPKINIHRTGTLAGIYYAKPSERYPDQPELKVQGAWEAEGAGHFYLPYFVVREFTAAGLIRYDGEDQRGEPKLTILNPRQRLCILREEEGRKKVTRVWPIDASGQPVTLPAQPAPPEPNLGAAPAAAPGAPAPSAAPPARATPGAPAAPAAAAAPASAPPGPAAAPAGRNGTKPLSAQDKAAIAKLWKRNFDLYGACTQAAANALAHALGCKTADLDQSAVQAGAATLMIQGRDLPTYVGLYKDVFAPEAKPANGGAQAPREPAAAAAGATHSPLDSYPEALDEEDDDDLPF